MRITIIFFLFSVFTINFLPGQTFTEILGRPTDNSITLSIMFDKPVSYYVEYGSTQGTYSNSTTSATAMTNVPEMVDLTGLLADAEYFYRTRYHLQGSTTYLAGPERKFHTQRPEGSSFAFTIESDEHMYDKKGVESIYKITLANQALDRPDFMFSLGDTYGDDHHPGTMTSGYSDTLHRYYRSYLGSICHSIPYFFCLGNHEGEFNYYLAQNPPNNIAVYGTLWRKFYYPGPEPNSFYSGNTDSEPYGMGNPQNYYSWKWGDALFVVLDVYRYQCDTSAKPTNWAWTLGKTQYDWLKNTLEQSTSKFKFVFAHHTRGQGRGGITTAKYFEWGGYEQDGTRYTFNTKRPGWAKPIHQLFVDNGVNIFFQGHDHLFAHEVLDGVTYQEVPMPSDSTYEIGMLANADAYVSDTIGGTGHLKVTVTQNCVRVDFIRAYLPADTVNGTHHNREIAFSYVVGDGNCPALGMEPIAKGTNVEIFPNPASDMVTINLPRNSTDYLVTLLNTLGQVIKESRSATLDLRNIPNGFYFLLIRSGGIEETKKLIVSH
ncbi:MAG: T9SS type A sorting domain-containing protein [Bacteroidota bacterium]